MERPIDRYKVVSIYRWRRVERGWSWAGAGAGWRMMCGREAVTMGNSPFLRISSSNIGPAVVDACHCRNKTIRLSDR